MTQITPVNNPFSAFKMPDVQSSRIATSQGILPHAVTNNTLQNQADAVELNTATNSPSAQNSVSEQNGTKKYFDIKTLAKIGAALAVGAGVVYAFKTHKIPFFKGGKQATESLADTAAQLGKKSAQVLEDTTSNLAKTAVQTGEQAADVAKEAAASLERNAQTVLQQGDSALHVASDVPKGDKKAKEVGFVIAAFSTGFIARAFKDFLNGDDAKALSLRKQIIEKEMYLKDVEIPFVEQEAAEYYENYKSDIIQAIDSLDAKASQMKLKFNNAVANYKKLKEGSYVEYFDDTNAKKLVVNRRENGSVKLEEFLGNNGSVVTHYNSSGMPIIIEYCQDGKVRLKARYKFSPDTAEPYLSQMLIYTKGSNKASLISFDANGNPEFYLARNNEGKLIKAFDIDSNTLDVKTIILPDREGENWLKRYTYEDGTLKSVSIMPSNDLPARKYNFVNGVVQSLDLFNNLNESPVLHVPFEDVNQSEFIAK